MHFSNPNGTSNQHQFQLHRSPTNYLAHNRIHEHKDEKNNQSDRTGIELIILIITMF